MVRPDDWSWILRARPYARRRAFNVCVERNVYEPPPGRISSRRLEEQYPIVEEAVSRAEGELWNSAVVWANEDHYRRFLGNRAAWRARDLCDRHLRPIPETAKAPSSRPPGERLDFQEAFNKLSPLQQAIMRRRYYRTCYFRESPMPDRELPDQLQQQDGVVNEKGLPMERWRVTRERMATESSLEQALGPDWKHYVVLYLYDDVEDPETED